VRDSEQAGPDRGDFLSGAYQQRGGASGFQAKSDGGDYDGLRMRGTLHGSRSPIAQLQNIGRTTMAAPLEDDILPTLEQLGRLAAAHLGTNAGSVFDALGIRGAVEKAQARRRKTGSANVKKQQSYGPAREMSEAMTEALYNFVLHTDCFLTQKEYGDRHNTSQATVSLLFNKRRREEGKKAITRKQRSRTPSNAKVARILDMMLSCHAGLKAYGWQKMAYQDESKILWGKGNHVEMGWAESGKMVASDYPHHPSSATLIMAIEYLPKPRLVKVIIQPKGCREKDVTNFFNGRQGAPHPQAPPRCW